MIRFPTSGQDRVSREDFRGVLHRSLRNLAYEQERVVVERRSSAGRQERRKHDRRTTAAPNPEFRPPAYESSIAWLEARQRMQGAVQAEGTMVVATLAASTEERAEVVGVWTQEQAAARIENFKKSPPRAPRTLNAEF